MIITEHFVFLGMPKTASCWVVKILTDNFNIVYQTDKLLQHGGYQDIPEQFQHLPTFGVIRPMNSWCVSAYNHFRPWVKRGVVPPGYEVYYNAVKESPHLEALYASELERMFAYDTELLSFDNLRIDLICYLEPWSNTKIEDDITNSLKINVRYSR